ncbi:helix-turn-helix transcriptional regulator [Nonomuraea longicatena]|uniref:Helix-turn-helix transcriptional regulator n=1 Tax=Nonomuraea longicatena TaxID=83682 RepID=A0ABN1P2J9_9ACTN
MADVETIPANPLAHFGDELRRYRLEKGYTIEQLAARVRFSASMVGAVERAQRRPSYELIEGCEKALDLAGELVRTWARVSKETSPPWFRPWTHIEERAVALRTWEPLLIPGLIQTPEYARAVLTYKRGVTREGLDQAVEERLARQRIFDRPKPPVFSAVLDEGVLLRPIGGSAVMRQQLEHLLKLASYSNVMLQILPLDLGLSLGMEGGFIVADLPGDADAAYFSSSAKGLVSNREDEVREAMIRFEQIRARAHPLHVSEGVIRKVLMTKYGHA